MKETGKKIVAFFNASPRIILFGFFLLSVLVRLPNLNRPLSKHHELNAALVLINAEEWNKKGPAFYNYVPVHSYHQPGDDIYNKIGQKGNQYLVNVSFGSLWYILPYGFFKVLSQQPSPLILQLFNLLLHLITVFLIYHLALCLFKDDSKALLTSVFYLFSPSPLWFHGNGYMHEVAVLPFIYGATLLYINMRHQAVSWIRYLSFSLLVIGGICCDWLMCFVAAGMFIISLADYHKQRSSSDLIMLFVIAIAACVGVYITFWQFSSFMGMDEYTQALLSRYLLRGFHGLSEGGGLSHSAGIGLFYVLGFGMLIPVTFIALIFGNSMPMLSIDKGRVKGFISVAIIICILHHGLFWGFSNIHDYAVIKAGMVVSMLAALATSSISNRKKKLVLVTAIILSNTCLYYYINPPGEYAANGQPYSYFKDLGEKVRTYSKPGDYIFIDTPEMSLLLTYYSKRYYRNVKDLDEAKIFFNALPGKDAVYIRTDNFRFVDYTRLNK